jgi:hypothetical protein
MSLNAVQAALCGAVFGLIFGLVVQENHTLRECAKRGKFQIGDTVVTCTLVKEK